MQEKEIAKAPILACFVSMLILFGLTIWGIIFLILQLINL